MIKENLEGENMAKRVGLSIYGLSLYSSEKEKNINLNDVIMSKSIIELIM